MVNTLVKIYVKAIDERFPSDVSEIPDAFPMFDLEKVATNS